jgi:transcriptional regulator with XRE-family HTH domain
MPAAQKPVNRLVGEQIRLRRCALGLTQSQLAERMGRHYTTVSLVERGVNNISVYTLERFAKALGTSAKSLIPF